MTNHSSIYHDILTHEFDMITFHILNIQFDRIIY